MGSHMGVMEAVEARGRIMPEVIAFISHKGPATAAGIVEEIIVAPIAVITWAVIAVVITVVVHRPACSGTAGQYVAMAALTPNLDAMQTASGKGVFGGSMQFLVTKSLNAVGPTWSLVHFKGPGGLASLSRINTDKMTLAFAEGPNAGTKMVTAVTPTKPNQPNSNAHNFLQKLFVGSINSQLANIQNAQH
jgi:hypothetical protein